MLLNAFRLRAKYNILTPAALLGAGLVIAAAGPALAADQTNPAGTTVTNVTILTDSGFTNAGTVHGSGDSAVASPGDVTFITNQSTGLIESSTNDTIAIGGSIDNFTNNGQVTANSGAGDAVYINNDVTSSFINTGDISSYGDYAVEIDGTTNIFDNQGTIGTFTGPSAIYFGDNVSSFSNEGTIQTDSYDGEAAVIFNAGVTSFANTNAIKNTGFGDGVDIFGASADTAAAGTFINKGSIWSGKATGVAVSNTDGGPAANTIDNSGSIVGTFDGLAAHGDVGNFTNEASGLIKAVNTDPGYYGLDAGNGTATAVYIDGSLTNTFSNAGTIVANGNFSGKGFSDYSAAAVTAGVGITGDVAKFINTGDIEGNDGTFREVYDGEFYSLGAGGFGVVIGGDVGSFENGGTIHGTSGGVFLGPYVDEYLNGLNSGYIPQYDGEFAVGHIGSFVNDAGATIQGDAFEGVFIADSIDNFVNHGSIMGPEVPSYYFGSEGNGGVLIGGGVGSFTNTGKISGYNDGAALYGGVGGFNNSGTITGSNGKGVFATMGFSGFDGESFAPIPFGNFVNSGTISGWTDGLYVDNATAIDINNSGTIEALEQTSLGAAAGVVFGGGTLENSGTIKGQTGVLINGDSSGDVAINSVVTNSGSIIGTHGAGIQFGAVDPTVVTSGLISGSTVSIQFSPIGPNDLVLKSGAQFIGAVDFQGAPSNTIDFSGYNGNMLFSYTGGDPTVAAGGKLYVDDGAGKIAIVDDTAIRDAAQPIEDLVGALHDSIGGALSGDMSLAGGQSFVMNYAPSKPMTPAATAASSVATPPAPDGVTIWGNVFGGGDSNTGGANASTAFGGFVAGAQSEFQPGLMLGVIGSYGRTSFSVDQGPQTVTGDVGTIGVYGETKLDLVTLDFSLLGGVGSNASSRTVSTPTGSDVATASFNSWFIAPQIGASIPVLHFDNDGQMNLAGTVGYIGGGFGGYTESGSVADITVGGETIGLFTASAEINAKATMAHMGASDVTLSGKLGVFTQDNVSGSSVPVSVLGLATVGSSASGATGTGVYAGFGVDAPVSQGFVVSASVTASARSDGTYGGLGRIGISGKY